MSDFTYMGSRRILAATLGSDDLLPLVSDYGDYDNHHAKGNGGHHGVVGHKAHSKLRDDAHCGLYGGCQHCEKSDCDWGS